MENRKAASLWVQPMEKRKVDWLVYPSLEQMSSADLLYVQPRADLMAA